MACWKGSSQGMWQNCCCGQVSRNTTKKEGKSAYVSGLVHVNPSSVNVESCSWVAQELEFVCPVPSQKTLGNLGSGKLKSLTLE